MTTQECSVERTRLAALHRQRILDTPAEERFDRFTRIATRLFDVPIALLSLVDERRQWFKSKQGLDASETARDISFCTHAVADDEMLVVEDAHTDERFRENPLVCGAPHIRFYAGQPVHAPDGSPIGTICLIDKEPREFNDEDRALLVDLSESVEKEFDGIRVATTDPVTGLSNAVGFRALAERVLSHCKQVEVPVRIVFLTLDEYERTNRVGGRRAGNALLAEFADALTASFNAVDVLGYIGEGEFLAARIGDENADLSAALRRLGAEVERLAEERSAPPIEYSVGRAAGDCRSVEAIDELLRR